jgi:hypothetical protein
METYTIEQLFHEFPDSACFGWIDWMVSTGRAKRLVRSGRACYRIL